MRGPRRGLLAALFLAGTLAVAGCPSESPPPQTAGSPPTADGKSGTLSPNARADIHAMLVEDHQLERDPSDGGGRAWLVSATPIDASGPTDSLVAGSRARFELVYEAGPLGVARGGAVYMQASPFWGWDTPQVQEPAGPGFTRVSTRAEGVELRARTVDQQLLQIQIVGRELRPGEQILLTYGAGPAGARVDQFAERGEQIFFAVDGDGDGLRGLLPESPRVNIVAGPAARLELVLPSVVRPGESATLHVVWLDALNSAGVEYTGDVEISPPAPDVQLEPRVSFAAADAGVRTVGVRVGEKEGIVRLRARGRVRAPDGQDVWVDAESNPMLVSASAPRILWGDLHGHSQFSDGTGRPDDYFGYARDVAGLDVAALTDHDHWGMEPLDDRPQRWKHIREVVAEYYEPGRFVTILGYEWTSWLYGHRHVLHFADDGPLWSSIDPETTTPDQLWSAIGDRGDLTFAHHSAGGPVAIDWHFRPPPQIEPVTEVVSVHGSSEAMDSPGRIYDPQPGNFVRDVLDDGVRFGFIGSGDSHDGHPGFTHLLSGQGGLAAIFAEERTRDAVRGALLGRRCYATSGPRIWMRTALDGHPMGALLPPGEPGSQQSLEVAVVSPGELERLDVVRSGELATSVDAEGEREFSARFELPALAAGEYLYVRAVQRDGGAAWSSPFYAGE